MSNRTLIELNHDFCPHGHDDIVKWANAMITYIRSGDKRHLPHGVEFVHMRHHSEPSPIAAPVEPAQAEPKCKRCLGTKRIENGWGDDVGPCPDCAAPGTAKVKCPKCKGKGEVTETLVTNAIMTGDSFQMVCPECNGLKFVAAPGTAEKEEKCSVRCNCVTCQCRRESPYA